jgi:iron complex transport system substrate-binding protein
MLIKQVRQMRLPFDWINADNLARGIRGLPGGHLSVARETLLMLDPEAVFIDAAGEILFKERFEDIDPEKKADEIYTFRVGRPVYKEMAADCGPIGRLAPFLKISF